MEWRFRVVLWFGGVLTVFRIIHNSKMNGIILFLQFLRLHQDQ